MGSLPDLPGDQTEQNSDAVEFAPPWQTLPDELLRDMFTEKGVDYAEPMPPRPVPSELTCPKKPPCTDLLTNLAGVLRDEKRWPNHLCEELFQRRSTLEWAE